MKNFKSFIKETPSWNGVDVGADISLASPAVIQKINALMGYIIKEDQIDHQAAISQIRRSLSKLGLTFDAVAPFSEAKGQVELPLTLYGGRFGKTPDTPHDQFLEDDGLSDKIEGGLKLVISYEKTEHNACRMRAHIH